MSESTRLQDDIEELPSLEFCEHQQENLLKDMDTIEKVSPHTGGKPVRQICTINKASKIIILCGHLCGCHDCIKCLINMEVFFQFTMTDGTTEDSNRRLPKTCSTYRAIIGNESIFFSFKMK